MYERLVEHILFLTYLPRRDVLDIAIPILSSMIRSW